MVSWKKAKALEKKGIITELIKWGCNTLTWHLLKVLDDYWNGNLPLPRTWVDAVVIRKIGLKTDPGNYRNFYVSILCERLKAPLIQKLSMTQYGFHEEWSIEQAFLRVRTNSKGPGPEEGSSISCRRHNCLIIYWELPFYIAKLNWTAHGIWLKLLN